MRFRLSLAVRKMNVTVSHTQQSATQILVRFLFGLPSKIIGLADEIGAICHGCLIFFVVEGDDLAAASP
jgi:hypothetical protein